MARNKRLDEFEEVTVKVPKRLMRLIEDQTYFGRTKDKFFTDCIRRGVCCDLSELDSCESERLEHKYGVKADLIVDLSKGTLLKEFARMDEEECLKLKRSK